MTIGTMDIYLLVIIVAALVVGFFWGAARSLMLLAAWLLAFVVGAYLQLQLGSYLAAQWTNYLSAFSEMAAFGIIYMGILLAAPIVIVASTTGSQQFSASQALDDVAGALVAMFVAILGIAGLMIVLATFYGHWEPFVGPGRRAGVDGPAVPVARRLDHRRRHRGAAHPAPGRDPRADPAAGRPRGHGLTLTARPAGDSPTR